MKVLIVEDETDLQDVLMDFLSKEVPQPESRVC